MFPKVSQPLKLDIHSINPFFPTVPTFAVWKTASLGIMGAPRVPPLNPSETTVLWNFGQTQTERADPCESKPHKGHLTSKPNYKRYLFYLLCTLLLFIFHILPSPVHTTGFSFCFFPGFLAIIILFSSQQQQQQQRITRSSPVDVDHF